MKRNRGTYSPAFKAMVAMEALKGEETVAQLYQQIGQLNVERDLLVRTLAC